MTTWSGGSVFLPCGSLSDWWMLDAPWYSGTIIILPLILKTSIHLMYLCIMCFKILWDIVLYIDVLLACGFCLEVDIFHWLCLMILVIWSILGICMMLVLDECSSFWGVLCSWLVGVTLEVVSTIRIPCLGLFYDFIIYVWILNYLSYTVRVGALLGDHAIRR